MRINIDEITLPDDFHEITDFYIPQEKPMLGVTYPKAVKLNERPEYTDVINIMLENAKKAEKLEFALEMIHEGEKIILRGHSINSVEGKIFIFRRLPSYIPEIDEIGMSPQIIELLSSNRLNSGGLIIIAGETGQGKSTTAAATIAYRLKKYGSFCLTIEDPIELPLQGFYPNEEDEEIMGICFQTDTDIDGVEAAIKSSLRCYPSVSNSILFLGETRDSTMAAEVLKIAANGHLVITTMHGGDLKTSLSRFINLATSQGSISENEIKAMFSSVFRLIIHQKMIKTGTMKRLKAEILYSPSSSSPIATRLKDGRVDMLSTDIQTQNVSIAKGVSILKDQ